MSTNPKQSAIELPRGLSHLSSIKRYWDGTYDVIMAKILPGEYYVTTEDEAVITVLGSCVSACIRDSKTGVGGMNHFMLPANKEEARGVLKKLEPTGANRYGNFAMESLINDILKNGGQRKNLEVKIVGGGKILENMNNTNIGDMNIKFVEDYIDSEGLKLVGSDVGDIYPRKVMYIPSTGAVKVKRLRTLHNNTVTEREAKYKQEIQSQPVGGEIELF